MSFYNTLLERTRPAREYLLTSPIILRALDGRITLEEYTAFLVQAYHHVRHTVPLLMATGSRMDSKQEWLREAIAGYIEEELGHQEWILDDIQACGLDREKARESKPGTATELMIAYAYDTVQRINPLGFFGMVLVLEGTSVELAGKAADIIQDSLGLPDNAFSYLRSHGSLDQEHIRFYEKLVDKIPDQDDQKLIIHTAKMFYKLYADIFRTLHQQQPLAA